MFLPIFYFDNENALLNTEERYIYNIQHASFSHHNLFGVKIENEIVFRFKISTIKLNF